MLRGIGSSAGVDIDVTGRKDRPLASSRGPSVDRESQRLVGTGPAEGEEHPTSFAWLRTRAHELPRPFA